MLDFLIVFLMIKNIFTVSCFSKPKPYYATSGTSLAAPYAAAVATHVLSYMEGTWYNHELNQTNSEEEAKKVGRSYLFGLFPVGNGILRMFALSPSWKVGIARSGRNVEKHGK